MRQWLLVVLLTVPGFSGAQPLLEFPDDFAFSRAEVNSVGVTTYGARLRTLRLAGRLDPDPALKARLQRILPRLLEAAAVEKPSSALLAWEVHACGRCDENASAQPGGKLLVSADFVTRYQLTDDELAYLLAHEVGHVLAEHTREFATAARYFLDNGLNRSYGDIQQELGENLPALLRMEPMIEQQEREADYIGFFVGARAGFDPEAMLSLLLKMGPKASGVLETHPSQGERRRRAWDMLEAARNAMPR
jgi:predicted Zn-dependent protease